MVDISRYWCIGYET